MSELSQLAAARETLVAAAPIALGERERERAADGEREQQEEERERRPPHRLRAASHRPTRSSTICRT